MKSDVIRKRSRHDARRVGAAPTGSPSASPGASRRTSPNLERSPTLAPDSTTTPLSYDFGGDTDYHGDGAHGDHHLMGGGGALVGHDGGHGAFADAGYGGVSFSPGPFPGPYHPDVLMQFSGGLGDALPYASGDSSDLDESVTGTPARSNKRRRMSTDSASEPPSSAVSYGSYDGYSSASSATSLSQRSSMDFPFSNYPSFNILRGPATTFWHPPMLPQDSTGIHPPMLPPDESPMDYLHPPMLPQDEENLFSTYLHPPMVLHDEHSPAPMNALPHPPMLPNDSNFSDFYDQGY